MDDWNPQEDAPPKKRSWAWLVALVSVVLLVVAGWLAWPLIRDARGPKPAETADAGVAMETPDAGPTVSISEGEGKLKELGAKLSGSNVWLKWLEEADLVRRLTAAANLVADGESPRPVVAFLGIDTPYVVDEAKAPAGKKAKKVKPPKLKKGQKPPPAKTGPFYVSAKSHARYDGVATAVSSIDAKLAGSTYRLLQPYFDAAFAEIGKPGKTFEQTLTQAFDRVLGLQYPQGQLELVLDGAMYKYKDPALEGLSAAEKHALRLGPANLQKVQKTLRAFAESAQLDVKPAP